ncbi:MAG: hypothetical protein NTV93_06095 [Verrucomicrobia bacterium]|nr:hypothetical protein [Verrucomicrobiota bacterium]
MKPTEEEIRKEEEKAVLDGKTNRLRSIPPQQLLEKVGPVRAQRELLGRIWKQEEKTPRNFLVPVERHPAWPDEERILTLIGRLTLLEIGLDD